MLGFRSVVFRRWSICFAFTIRVIVLIFSFSVSIFGVFGGRAVVCFGIECSSFVEFFCIIWISVRSRRSDGWLDCSGSARRFLSFSM